MAIENVLFSFDAFDSSNRTNASGANPYAAPTSDAQGHLYGTAASGGTNGTGTVYELVPGGDNFFQRTLFSFDAVGGQQVGNASGAYPGAVLIADAQGNLYGTASEGGRNNTGTVYELVKGASGYTHQTLYSFDAQINSTNSANASGAGPAAGVIADGQGNLFGTASDGGANGTGTVYELVKGLTGYTQKTLFSFAAANAANRNATGADPRAGLTADAQGNLYGTTEIGGTSGTGAVYELVNGANGYAQQTLYSFDADSNAGGNASGNGPFAGVIADASGNLYGTTLAGGANETGTVYELVKSGDSYTQRTLFSFAANNGGNATGSKPVSGLIADAKGNLYGTTARGGANDGGAVFELVRAGDSYTEQVLLSFAAYDSANPSNATGAIPFSDLIADAQGNLYGTTIFGGPGGNGVAFRLTGTDFTTPCYCSGTRIRVSRASVEADVAVETLSIGDLVVTASGEHRPIRWLGKRSYIGRFANRNPELLPMCFKAGSLADNVPARDLWVSPKHAMFLDGVLVPAEHLVNDVSVVKAARVDRVDYHHVELESHDVLLAEGAPSESFVDDEGRHIFHNAHEHAALYPDAVRAETVYCAPRIEHGEALEAIRGRIDARALGAAAA